MGCKQAVDLNIMCFVNPWPLCSSIALLSPMASFLRLPRSMAGTHEGYIPIFGAQNCLSLILIAITCLSLNLLRTKYEGKTT